MFGQSASNNSVCRFYQRGNCKYGSKCWYVHQRPANANGNVFGTASTYTGFGGNNNSNSMQDKQFLEFVQQVGTEMKNWETTGMWLLSCLAPLKEHPLLAGFVDTSPEEIRVEAYEALKTNSFPVVNKLESVTKKLEYHKQIRQALKNQTPEAMEALRAVYYKTSSPSTGEQQQTSSLFGKPATSSLFKESSNNQPSIFGGANNNKTSIFGTPSTSVGANSLFGSKPQNSAFGAAPVFGTSTTNAFGSTNAFKPSTGSIFGAQPQSSLFGGTSSGQSSVGIFGNSSNSTSLFGGGSQIQNTSNVFGSNQTLGMSTNMFVGANSNQASSNLFGNTNQAQGNLNNTFGGTPAVGTSNIFGSGAQNQGNTTSLFGGAIGGAIQNQETTNMFGTSNQNQTTDVIEGVSQLQGNNQASLFGASTNSLFGGAMNSNLASNTNNLFNNNTNNNNNTFSADTGTSQQQNSTVNIFGNANKNLGNSVFGGFSLQNQNNSNSQGQNMPNLNMAAGNTVFGGGMFSQNNNNSNNNNNGLLGSGANNATSVFGMNNIENQNNPSLLTTSSVNSQSIFGEPNQSPFALNSSQQQNSQISSSNSQSLLGQFEGNVYEAVYTPLHMLSEEDRAEFERDVFIKIPLVPPPRELCI